MCGLGTRNDDTMTTKQCKRNKKKKIQGMLRFATWNIKSWLNNSQEVIGKVKGIIISSYILENMKILVHMRHGLHGRKEGRKEEPFIHNCKI